MEDAVRGCDLRKGDLIAVVISNCPSVIVMFLVTLWLGAIFSTSSTVMSVSGVMDRLEQIQPKIIIFDTAVLYNGKPRSLLDKVEHGVTPLPNVPNVPKISNVLNVPNVKRLILIICDGVKETKGDPKVAI